MGEPTSHLSHPCKKIEPRQEEIFHPHSLSSSKNPQATGLSYREGWAALHSSGDSRCLKAASTKSFLKVQQTPQDDMPTLPHSTWHRLQKLIAELLTELLPANINGVRGHKVAQLFLPLPPWNKLLLPWADFLQEILSYANGGRQQNKSLTSALLDTASLE